MKKYCFEVAEIRTRTALVRIDAESKEKAEEILENLYEKNRITFNNPRGEDSTELKYQIDSFSCNEDDSFDEEQYSDEGIQFFAKK